MLWVKCDDQCGPLYGGNKPRKLEYLVAQALRRGRAGLITTGAIGTHHGLATAIAARAAKLRAVLVLLPQPVTEHVRESLLLAHAHGAELHLAESVAGVAAVVARLYASATLRGAPLALIPTGGTSAIGAIGFVRAGLELADQVRRGELPEPDAIFVALGTGGTAAGLLAGLRLAGLRSRVVAVLVTDILPPTAPRLLRLAKASVRLMRRAGEEIGSLDLAPDSIVVESDYLGGGYGEPTDEGAAATVAGEVEGIELEQTYTAKTFAAFIDAARSGAFGENLLFWNTYNSIDVRARIGELPPPEDLPQPFHRFFAD